MQVRAAAFCLGMSLAFGLTLKIAHLVKDLDLLSIFILPLSIFFLAFFVYTPNSRSYVTSAITHVLRKDPR
jgi:hypothetical protein